MSNDNGQQKHDAEVEADNASEYYRESVATIANLREQLAAKEAERIKWYDNCDKWATVVKEQNAELAELKTRIIDLENKLEELRKPQDSVATKP